MIPVFGSTERSMVSMLMTCVHLEFGYLCHIPMITWDQGWLRGEREKTCKPKVKDILVVEDLRKEVHCFMQIKVQTREVIKRTRGVSGLVPVSAATKR